AAADRCRTIRTGGRGNHGGVSPSGSTRTDRGSVATTPRSARMTARSLQIAPEVREALASGAPVVALESTIVAHGMPYPQNVATARSLEEEVREKGATPATIAVIGGVIRVGLSADELEWLGAAKDVLKLSRNDLPYALAARKHGATT